MWLREIQIKHMGFRNIDLATFYYISYNCFKAFTPSTAAIHQPWREDRAALQCSSKKPCSSTNKFKFWFTDEIEWDCCWVLLGFSCGLCEFQDQDQFQEFLEGMAVLNKYFLLASRCINVFAFVDRIVVASIQSLGLHY